MKRVCKHQITAAFLSALSLIGSSTVSAQTRSLNFSGIEWDVWGSSKNGIINQSWSDSTQSVWLDDQNQLHMKFRRENGNWLATAIQSQEFFGYGDYRFFVQGDVEAFHENLDVGLFTFEWIDENTFREIDIELSRFTDPAAPAGHFVVQPYFVTGNIEAFDLSLTGDFDFKTTHRFVWEEDSVFFQSYRGHPHDFDQLPDRNQLIYEWHYTGSHVPPAERSNLYLNFFLTGLLANPDLASLVETEITFNAVRFTPLPEPTSLACLIGLGILLVRRRRLP